MTCNATKQNTGLPKFRSNAAARMAFHDDLPPFLRSLMTNFPLNLGLEVIPTPNRYANMIYQMKDALRNSILNTYGEDHPNYTHFDNYWESLLKELSK